MREKVAVDVFPAASVTRVVTTYEDPDTRPSPLSVAGGTDIVQIPPPLSVMLWAAGAISFPPICVICTVATPLVSSEAV